MGLRIEIDHALCGGASECVASLPGVFELNADGRAAVCGDPDVHGAEACLAAAWACPTSAITVFDGDVALDPYPS